MKAHHLAIISHKLFNAVQRKKHIRSRSQLASR